jgi:hypothetical protein
LTYIRASPGGRSKQFFFEKKNQKTFVLIALRPHPPARRHHARHRRVQVWHVEKHIDLAWMPAAPNPTSGRAECRASKV